MASDTNAELLEDAAAHWWLLLLQGVLAILIGWLLLSRPVGTTLVLVQFLGLYWLIAGIVDIVVAIVDKAEEHRWLKLFGGLIGVIAGLIVLNNAVLAGVLTPTIMLWMIAFAFIIGGIIRIFLGNKTAEAIGYEWSWGQFFLGIFYVLFGIVLLGLPLIGKFATMVSTAGLLGVVGGIVIIILSFRLRGAYKQLQK